MQYPYSIVRIILEDESGNILLLKRSSSYGKDQWCLPGGKVDYKKTVVQTCIDEVKEETNLDISDIEFLFYQDSMPIKEGGMHCINFYFKAQHSDTIKLKLDESSKYRWVAPEGLSSYDIAFRNYEGIERYLASG